MIALAENDDRHTVLEFCRHVCNHMNVASDNDSLDKHAAILAEYVGMIDGWPRILNADGTPRMTDTLDGTGVQDFYPFERFINEELCRDRPEFRWKPYP